MSRMSDVHQDLESIHNILLGQRKVAQDTAFDLKIRGCNIEAAGYDIVVGTINDLLLEFEAAGVVWPGNVVSLEERITEHVGPPMDTVKFLGRVHRVVKHPKD